MRGRLRPDGPQRPAGPETGARLPGLKSKTRPISDSCRASPGFQRRIAHCRRNPDNLRPAQRGQDFRRSRVTRCRSRGDYRLFARDDRAMLDIRPTTIPMPESRHGCNVPLQRPTPPPNVQTGAEHKDTDGRPTPVPPPPTSAPTLEPAVTCATRRSASHATLADAPRLPKWRNRRFIGSEPPAPDPETPPDRSRRP